MSVLARRISWSRANLNLLYPALAILLTVFAVAPLAYPGFFQSYTGYAPVYNLIDLHARVTTFYTWSPMWGRVYDFLRMDGPLGYGLAEILRLVGFSALTGIKAIYALAFVVSGLSMFKLAQRVFQNDAAALLASALYVYFPAHIAAVYVRGAFGEAVAWAIFPLAMWCAIELENKTPRTRRDAVWTIISFAALMLAQPGLAILFGIFVRVWLLFVGARPNQTRGFFQSLTFNAILLGLALGAVLQLPSILQQRGISASDLFVPAFVYPFQMFSAAWGADIPRGDWLENAPYQIGFAALGLTILALALLFRSESKAVGENPARPLVLFSVVASAFFLILMTPLAERVWEFLGLDFVMQYPFQLLAFVGFLLPFAAGSIIISDARFQDLPLLAVLIIIPLLAVYPYLAPAYTDLNPTQPALARFNNDELALLDAKIVRPPGTWRHGATIELDLTWQALKQPNHDYTVFMRVLDNNGQTWGTTDEKPQDGNLSTLNMVAGRVYTDTKTVQINLEGPNEGYRLELGLYQNATQERARTETGADVVRIDELQ